MFSLIVLFVLSSFHGIFLTEARFCPEGRRFSRNCGCQDVAVPPQIRVWARVLFVFVVISPLLWRSLAIFGRVLSIVVLVYFYRCSFYRCGARNFHRCILPGHIVASLFFVSLPSVATSSFPLCTPRSVFAYQFFFLSSSRFQPEGVLSVLSCCVWQECRSQLLLRCISPRLLSASLPGRGKKFR